MQLASKSVATVGLAIVSLLCGAGSSGAANEPASPILVELFTSQGCSSCPPADRLLSELAESGEVVALAFHVDYWNYIGWTDPFSSAEWSDRQREYGLSLRARTIYTPQLVINGRRHAVGSDRREVAAMIRQASGDRPAGSLAIAAARSGGDRITARLAADIDPGLATGDLVAWVALVEDGLETPVGRGENARRTLFNNRVVRRLERAARLERGETTTTATVDLEIDESWRADELSLVAFLQDPESLHVVATAAAVID